MASSSSSTVVSLLTTGITLGILHVLTGPDHLSAIVTLSANVHWLQAFWLGVRWGIGHSTGLLLIGLIFIILTIHTDAETIEIPEYLSKIFESLVGVFMLALGIYGVRRACIRKTKASYTGIHEPDAIVDTELQPIEPDLCNRDELVEEHDEKEPTPVFNDESQDDPIQKADNPTMAVEETSPSAEIVGHDASVPISQNGSGTDNDENTPSTKRPCCLWLMETVPTSTLALSAGMLHGLAGPGGVLGVIPAVQLHNWKLASIYLACFCITSTITMGIFATLYGFISSKVGSAGAKGGDEENSEVDAINTGANQPNSTFTRTTFHHEHSHTHTGTTTDHKIIRRQFFIECFSACLSIVVGIIWIVLSTTGKMEEVFH